ncbi:hypothetical protein [uncultured Psychroserpens sp.]|uniref:hypothetical protein n=1 Tax=uncultured Psychroserpens sp. TaxID=255436 RepID=UPI00260D5100|nr:hypothetical protein [uncultured Psychroserpens sp.]
MDTKKIAELEAEINSLKKKIKSNSSVDRIFKIVATIATLSTILVGIFNYSDKKEGEFRKVFWEKRFEFYQKVTDLAAAIAIAKDLESVKDEREKFWILYWGKLSMIEDQAVFDAMVNYGDHLFNQEKMGQKAYGLKQRSYLLARACRNSLKETWEPVVLDDIKENMNAN